MNKTKNELNETIEYCDNCGEQSIDYIKADSKKYALDSLEPIVKWVCEYCYTEHESESGEIG